LCFHETLLTLLLESRESRSFLRFVHSILLDSALERHELPPLPDYLRSQLVDATHDRPIALREDVEVLVTSDEIAK
jgi:hypothetical protein